MRLDDLHKSIRLALIVIARFGFINRTIFFKYLGTDGKTQKYKIWKLFIKTGFVKSYQRIGVAEDYYSLSRKGLLFLSENGIRPVSKSHPLHFEHDEIAMGFAVACERNELIKSDWCPDKELRQLKPTEILSRYGTSFEKIPDLIFNIKTFNEFKICCAFEVERSRKSKQRYDSMVLNYAKQKNVNLILIAYKDRYVVNSILKSVKRLDYPQSSKPFVFCRISEVLENPSRFLINVGGNQISFDKYIENIRSLSQKKGNELSGKDSAKKFPLKTEAA